MMKQQSSNTRKYETIPLSEAREMKSSRQRKSPVLDKYKQYILDLKDDEAGRLSIENDRDGFAVRALLKRASEALNVTITIKKVNKQILFWKE